MKIKLKCQKEEEVYPLSFENFGLSPDLLNGLADTKIEKLTLLQSQVFPSALQGKNMLVKNEAEEVATFVIPALQTLINNGEVSGTHILILTPSVERAKLIDEMFWAVGYHTQVSSAQITMKGDKNEQEKAVLEQAPVLVANPGRLLEILEKNTFKLNNLKLIVIDEAQNMENFSLVEKVKAILRVVESNPQALIFSTSNNASTKQLTELFKSEFETIGFDAISTSEKKEEPKNVSEAVVLKAKKKNTPSKKKEEEVKAEPEAESEEESAKKTPKKKAKAKKEKEPKEKKEKAVKEKATKTKKKAKKEEESTTEPEAKTKKVKAESEEKAKVDKVEAEKEAVKEITVEESEESEESEETNTTAEEVENKKEEDSTSEPKTGPVEVLQKASVKVVLKKDLPPKEEKVEEDNSAKTSVEEAEPIPSDLTQVYINVPPRMKISTLLAHLEKTLTKKAVIFAASKRTTDRLFKIILKKNWGVVSVHQGIDKELYDERFAKFVSGEMKVLLVGGIPAQEIELDEVHQVINYDVPSEVEEYKYRAELVGNGKAARMVSLVSKMDKEDINLIVEQVGYAPAEIPLPEEVVEKKSNKPAPEKSSSNNNKDNTQNRRNNEKKDFKKPKSKEYKDGKGKKKGSKKIQARSPKDFSLPRPTYDGLSGGREGKQEKKGLFGWVKKLFD